MADVVAFSKRAKAQVSQPAVQSAPSPDMGDPKELGNIYVSDSKGEGSRFFMEGSRGKVKELNRSLTEGGAWFIFRPHSRVSEHHG